MKKKLKYSSNREIAKSLYVGLANKYRAMDVLEEMGISFDFNGAFDTVLNSILYLLGIPKESVLGVDVDSPEFNCNDIYDDLVYTATSEPHRRIDADVVIDLIITKNVKEICNVLGYGYAGDRS